ncbi:glycogen/starch synthase, partial [Modicisalibacter luteus]
MVSEALHDVFPVEAAKKSRRASRVVMPRQRRALNGRIGKDSDGCFHVLLVTSEIADFVKVGGLGDVSSALPRALASRHDVRILIPAYREMIASDHEIEILGKLPGHADIPPCELGKTICSDG